MTTPELEVMKQEGLAALVSETGVADWVLMTEEEIYAAGFDECYRILKATPSLLDGVEE